MSQQGSRSGGRLPLSAGLILVLLCFLWGAQAVSIKFSNQGVPPLMAAALRSLVAGILVWTYARFKGRGVAFPPGRNRHALVIGFLFGLEFLFVYWGLAFTPASRSAIFLYTHPFWVALGAHLFLQGDRLTPAKLCGLVLAFCGVVAVFQARSPELPRLYWVGDLMELFAAMSWAATTLYIKRITEQVSLDHFQTLFAQLIFSFPVLALGSVLFELPADLNLSGVVLAALFYQAVVVAFASYLVWFWLIHRHTVSRLAAFTFMAPLFAVILGGLVLDEPLTILVWVGLVCVAGGLYVVNR
ncbi:MAG: DMT family transporter [Deltaproteobacteria bacterium]|jgi:drug/metabolite transporter (DMT)-like permease|nr:DMT family transporter [Deltaproteobacteria bacterium]MBW2479155.1 DMT family transporter [Deltaproteobacteria bacterium]